MVQVYNMDQGQGSVLARVLGLGLCQVGVGVNGALHCVVQYTCARQSRADSATLTDRLHAVWSCGWVVC